MVVTLLVAAGVVTAVVLATSPAGAAPSRAHRLTHVAAQRDRADHYHGVNQALLNACIKSHKNCLKTVPGLARCVRRYKVCGLSAAKALATAQKVRPSHADTTQLSEAQVLAQLGWSNVPVGIAEMTYGQAQAAYPNLAASTTIPSSEEVWVVTAYFTTPITAPTDGGYGPPSGETTSTGAATESYSSESAVIDATTGNETDSCLGCTTVPEQ